MERFDIADDQRLAAMIDAVDRGEQVLITRDGSVVAEVTAVSGTAADGTAALAIDRLARLRAKVRLLPGRGVDLVREIRDERDG